MTTETLFTTGGETKPTEPGQTTTQEGQTLLTALVGEKQKYKSAEELAKAYVNADEFINTLKAENARLREEANKAKTIDEVLDRLNKTTTSSDNSPTTTQNTFDESKLADLVKNTLTKQEQEKIREANLLEADRKMKEKFGEKALEVFKQKADTPSKRQVMQELAAVDPNAFVNLFVTTDGGSTTPPSTGSVNTLATGNTSARASEWSQEWLKEVRTKEPSKYWSAEFQYQLQQKVVQNPKLYFKE